MNKKYAKVQSTRRSLIMSVLSLMLCFAMLIGTTYAWFTDSVTSGKNRIVAGNLDVEMFYKNALTSKDKEGDAQWANVVTAGENDPMFFVDAGGEKILWEPGVVSVCDFEVRNVGTLALKYKFNTEFEDGNDSGSTMKLSSVIKAAVVAADTDVSTREKAIAAGKAVEGGFQNLAVFANEGALAPQGKDAFKVILYWEPTENDDVYNMNNEKQDEAHDNTMWIDIDIKLIAAQLTEEKDSFDYEYDKDATYPGKTASDAALVLDPDDSGVVKGLPDGDTSETIIIPVTATKIADEAFKGNTNIKSISMPVTTVVGEDAFLGCTSLENVTLRVEDGEIAKLDTGCFANCPSLKKLTVDGDAELGVNCILSDYEMASDNVEIVFNGNVAVRPGAFATNGDSNGHATLRFNGDVKFEKYNMTNQEFTAEFDLPAYYNNLGNTFCMTHFEEIIFAAGKKVEITGNLSLQDTGLKRVVFEGPLAEGSIIPEVSFGQSRGLVSVTVYGTTKEAWEAKGYASIVKDQEYGTTIVEYTFAN